MGGKVWSDKEERVFWETVIPQSPIAPDPEDQKLSWDACSKAMQQAMEDEARREYTGSMLYEHYYQNLKPGPRPKAKKYFEKYIKDCERYKNENPSTPSSEENTVSTQTVEVEDPPPPASTPRPSSPARLPVFPGRPTSLACTKYMPGPDSRVPDRRFTTANGPIPPPSMDQIGFIEEGRRPRIQQVQENYTSMQRMDYYSDWRRPMPNCQNSSEITNYASLSCGRLPYDSRYSSPGPQMDHTAFRGRLPPLGSRPEDSGERIQLPPVRAFDEDISRTTQSLGASSGTLSESPGSSLATTLTLSTGDSPSSVSHHAGYSKRLHVQDVNEEDEDYDELPVKRRKAYKSAV